MTIRPDPKNGHVLQEFRKMSRLFRQESMGELKAVAELTKEESERRAPYLTGTLESAHKIEKKSDGYVVYVDEAMAPHAIYMHEGWGNFSESNPYKLGLLSEVKNDGPPHHEPQGVGLKFLSRAAEAVLEVKYPPRTASERILAKVKRFLSRWY